MHSIKINLDVVSVRFSMLGRICKALEYQPADILKYEDD